MKHLSLSLIALFLVGCGEQTEHPELERFIVQTYATAEVVATPLPPEPTYFPLAFSPPLDTDPFVLPAAEEEKHVLRGNCWQPDNLPAKDPLENFELSAFEFKGVIGSPGQYWALLQAPDDSLHRVGVGRMLGNNRGRVESISQHTLSITEHLPDGLGCWQVRNVKLALNNNQKG